MGEFIGKIRYFCKMLYAFSHQEIYILLEHVGMRKKEKLEHTQQKSNNFPPFSI